MRFFIILIVLLFPYRGFSQSEPFNEVFLPNGEMRPSYRNFTANSGIDPYLISNERTNYLLGKPLGDRVRILPLPAVLSDGDYLLLQTGAQQRARAMAAFFDDIIFNKGSKVREAGLLSEFQIETMTKLDTYSLNLQFLRVIWSERSGKDIRFVYGPDIVRTPSGEFMVIEDNMGLIGGLGDVAATHKSFYSFAGQESDFTSPLERAIGRFLSDIPREKWTEEVFALLPTNGHHPEVGTSSTDRESERIAKIVKDLGIKIVTYSELLPDDPDQRDLLFSLREGKYKKIINLTSIYNMGLEDRVLVPLLGLFKEKKFDFMYAPGIDFISNKAFLNYIDAFIQLYLNEKPILRSVKTRPFTDFDKTEHPGDFVFKRVNGSQGTEVYLARDMSQRHWETLLDEMHELQAYLILSHTMPWPSYVVQEFIEGSFIPAENRDSWVRFNIDFRPHVFYEGGDLPSPVIWGRANWKVPGSRNNVSLGAMEAVVSSESLCERDLMKP